MISPVDGRSLPEWICMARATFIGVGTLFLGLVAAVRAAPDAPAPQVESGMFITVNNPINSNVVAQIKTTISQAQTGKSLKKVVFDFNPGGLAAATDDIG